MSASVALAVALFATPVQAPAFRDGFACNLVSQVVLSELRAMAAEEPALAADLAPAIENTRSLWDATGRFVLSFDDRNELAQARNAGSATPAELEGRYAAMEQREQEARAVMAEVEAVFAEVQSLAEVEGFLIDCRARFQGA